MVICHGVDNVEWFGYWYLGYYFDKGMEYIIILVLLVHDGGIMINTIVCIELKSDMDYVQVIIVTYYPILDGHEN